MIGIAGNFVLGDSIREGVTSFAFSGLTGLVKTDRSVQVLDRQGQTTYALDTAPGPARFAFSADGAPAFAYLAATGEILVWSTDHFDTAPWQMQGTVLGIANPSAGVLTAIVERADGRWKLDFDASTGNLISQTGQTAGSESPEAVVEQMDKNWIHVMEPAAHKHYAIRLEPGHPRRYQLPETQP